MDAVIGVRGLRTRTVELVRRIGHVTVRGPLVRLAGPPPAQGLVGVVQAAPDSRKAFVSGLVEPVLGLCPPQPVLLRDQFLDLIQDRVFVHMPSIVWASARPNEHSRHELSSGRRRCGTPPAGRDPPVGGGDGA